MTLLYIDILHIIEKSNSLCVKSFSVIQAVTLNIYSEFIKRFRREPDLAGIVAVSDAETRRAKNVVYILAHCMRMLQHRGKAYWKIMVENNFAEGDGPLPYEEKIFRIVNEHKLTGHDGIGFLSKRRPESSGFRHSQIALDGFLVDTEKLYLHPMIGGARDSDPLYQIYCIFKILLTRNRDPPKATDFLDRHLRGNMLVRIGGDIYAYRNSTGFKPLVLGSNKKGTLHIIASENSLRISLIDLTFRDVAPGELLKLDRKSGPITLTKQLSPNMVVDPFEFIRESNAASIVNGKSIYEIRKNIGREQSKFLSGRFQIESAFAEPDYTRPMGLGFSLEYQKNHKMFEIGEGVIKDRYDDSDHMIDFSEEVSKYKLLTTGKSLKFVVENLVSDKSIGTIQGTIQTGATVKETIHYLKKAGAKQIIVVVSYPPTIDGRQVGLYTQHRDFVANKYVGKVSSIDEINGLISHEIGADRVYYNSPTLLARAVGIAEVNLWFPEWIRFLEYQ
jgi:amidophosphoribosyltransferase